MGTSKTLNCIGIQSEEDIAYENEVNHPDYYQTAGMECIDLMRLLFGDDAVIGFCKCNVFKYIYRAQHKGGQTDLDKAEWYAKYLDELSSEAAIPPMDFSSIYGGKE